MKSIQLPLLWSSNIFPSIRFIIICCHRKSCVVHSLQMLSPLSSLCFDLPHNVDITKLNHYDIIQNMVLIEKPVDGLNNIVFYVYWIMLGLGLRNVLGLSPQMSWWRLQTCTFINDVSSCRWCRKRLRISFCSPILNSNMEYLRFPDEIQWIPVNCDTSGVEYFAAAPNIRTCKLRFQKV
jgi:hypothetical protein